MSHYLHKVMRHYLHMTHHINSHSNLHARPMGRRIVCFIPSQICMLLFYDNHCCVHHPVRHVGGVFVTHYGRERGICDEHMVTS